MADSKISALPASTTPLGGTEALPIVQGGTTKQVTIANVTAGRDVSALSLTTTNNASINGISVGVGAGNVSGNTAFGSSALGSNVSGTLNCAFGLNALVSNVSGSSNTSMGYSSMTLTTGNENVAYGFRSLYSNAGGSNNTAFGSYSLYANSASSNTTAIGYQAGYSSTGTNNVFLGYNSGYLLTTGVGNIIIGNYNGTGAPVSQTGNNYVVLSDGNGNIKAYGDGSQNWHIPTGNLVIGTSGKGIDFSADGQAAGMTSELLDDYEEGTWSPTIVGSAVAGTVTYDARNASYTKIGRLVHVEVFMVYSAGTGSGFLLIGNLPYAVENTVITYTPIVCRQSSIAVPVGEQIYGRAEPGTSHISMYSVTDAGAQTNLAYDDDAYIAFQATYTAA